jgi:hypothetical protein
MRWRYEGVTAPAAPGPVPPPTAPPVFPTVRPAAPATEAEIAEARAADQEFNRSRAWQRLMSLHMPFHLASDAVYARLIGGLSDIEELFLARPTDADLASYYNECTRELDDVPQADTTSPTPRSSELAGSVRHVAALQVQFMEEVFKGFRLDRYANAPDSRGWMNTFRRWGCSPRFKAQFDNMEETLTESFVVFFYHHVRDSALRIEVRPVPHPWDPPRPRATKALPRTLHGLRGLMKHEDREAGIFLDSGISEPRPPQGMSTRTATQQSGAPESKENDVPPMAGSGGESPTPPPGGDTGPSPLPNA